MKAAVIDRFGGPEEFHVDSLSVPKPKAKEILVQLDVAGVSIWDPEIRKGEFKPVKPRFPDVIGNDGSGTITALGKKFRASMSAIESRGFHRV